jgi:hypothetical protein
MVDAVSVRDDQEHGATDERKRLEKKMLDFVSTKSGSALNTCSSVLYCETSKLAPVRGSQPRVLVVKAMQCTLQALPAGHLAMPNERRGKSSTMRTLAAYASLLACGRTAMPTRLIAT